jgi:hypothetical protein
MEKEKKRTKITQMTQIKSNFLLHREVCAIFVTLLSPFVPS